MKTFYRFLQGLLTVLVVWVFSLSNPVSAQAGRSLSPAGFDPSPPGETVRLIFIHHSSGENWLRDGYGNLGRTLGENNYFVSDTNYGWGPDSIGDRTDIPNWVEWFGENRSQAALDALYSESSQNSEYTRTLDDPGGENQIVMFKSCFPNSDLSGNPDDAPTPGTLDYTVGGAKAVYIEILEYFASRPDKMFVVVTAPPLSDPTHAANARAFNQWLVNDWLAGYTGNNVYVFDFYNVLTGANHHHRYIDGAIEHTFTPGADTSAYASSEGDDHPNEAGSQKATEEFIPLLNGWYHQWQSGGGAEPVEALEPTEASEEAQPVEEPTSEPEVQPPVSQMGVLLFDFEENSEGWNSYDDGLGTQITCAADSSAASEGSSSLHITYNLIADGYAGCGYDFDPSQNWTTKEGISFMLHASQEGLRITLLLPVGTSELYTPFEAYLETSAASVNGWEAIYIPWSGFNRSEWADEGGYETFDPTLVKSIAFDIGGEVGVESELWIDDIRLSQGEAQPTQEQEEGNTGIAEESNAAEPTATAEPDRGGRGLCGSSIALPIAAVVGVGLMRRKKKR